MAKNGQKSVKIGNKCIKIDFPYNNFPEKAIFFTTRSLRTLEPEHGEVTTRANGQFFYDFGNILAPLVPFGAFGAPLAPYFKIRRHI